MIIPNVAPCYLYIVLGMSPIGKDYDSHLGTTEEHVVAEVFALCKRQESIGPILIFAQAVSLTTLNPVFPDVFPVRSGPFLALFLVEAINCHRERARTDVVTVIGLRSHSTHVLNVICNGMQPYHQFLFSILQNQIGSVIVYDICIQ